MTTTLSLGGESIVPDLVLGYQADIQVTNIVHQIIGREQFPDVTFHVPTLRSGTLNMFFLDEAGATAAVALHSKLGILDLNDSTYPSLNMRYVPVGTISPRIEGVRWVIAVGFQELPGANTPQPPTMYPPL